jgi:hypothetical protein
MRKDARTGRAPLGVGSFALAFAFGEREPTREE